MVHEVPQAPFQIGPWQVYPRRHCLIRNHEVVHVEPRVMQVLVRLAQQPGETVTREALIDDVWMGAIVTDEAVTRAVSSLRKALDDDYRSPLFIETLPKAGYRLVAPVHVLHTPSNGHAMASSSPVHHGVERPPRRAQVRLLWSLPGLLLALILSGFMWFHLARSTTDVDTFRQRPLTSLPGAEFDPALSPNGTQVAFVWFNDEQAQYDLYVKHLDTEELTPLVGARNGFGPAWSPDGRHIAFIRYAEAGCEIVTVPVRGSHERKLGDCGDNFMGDLAWAPDGKTLLYSDRPDPEAPFGLIRLSLETLDQTPLTRPSGKLLGDMDPTFSPDGRYVAFIRYESFTMRDVYILPTDGGTARRLTFRHAPVEGLSWAPDGRAVIFAAGEEDHHRLLRVPLEGGPPEPWRLGNTGLRNPSLSNQTGRLAGEHWSLDVNIWQQPLTPTYEPTGTPTPLIASSRLDNAPDVAPDGRHLVFVSNRSGYSEVWMSRRDGTHPTRLTSLNAAYVGSPRWAPDGHHIVFEAHVEGNADLYLTDTAGTLPRRLTTDSALDVDPRWTRDGQWIYFGSNREDGWQIWKMPSTGGTPVRVTQTGGLAAEESIDGAWLYLVKADTTGIWRRPLQGGPEERILDAFSPRFRRHWTSTADGLVFLQEGEQKRHLYFHSFETRQQTLLASPRDFGSFALTPDGQSLLYSQVDHRESDIMMVEGLR